MSRFLAIGRQKYLIYHNRHLSCTQLMICWQQHSIYCHVVYDQRIEKLFERFKTALGKKRPQLLCVRFDSYIFNNNIIENFNWFMLNIELHHFSVNYLAIMQKIDFNYCNVMNSITTWLQENLQINWCTEWIHGPRLYSICEAIKSVTTWSIYVDHRFASFTDKFMTSA